MRRFFLIVILLFFASCSRDTGAKPQPVEFTRNHSCNVCGMIIVDFPGAKAQIHYKNKKIDTFCSTLDMFLFYLQPDRPANIVAIYVNDMGRAEGGLRPPSEIPLSTKERGLVGETLSPPRTHWIDAKSALYVFGGDVMGPMGEALVPFSDMKDAEEHIKKHGGRVIRFDDVKMDILKPE